MQFKVPQFIEIEDKIVGPLTLKQFFYLAGGAVFLGILWLFLKLSVFIIVAIPVSVFCLLLAFYKINGRPFISFLNSMLKYFTKPKLYLWKKNPK